MNAPRRKWFKRLGRLATLLGAFTLIWACNAPFIPVPPPGATFTAMLVTDGGGTQRTVWITHGLPSAQASLARYYVFNETLSAGIIATAGIDGTFTGTPMEGAENDRVQLYYMTPGGDYSDSICLLLTESVVGGSAPSCPPR